jgi:hypothetical protein
MGIDRGRRFRHLKKSRKQSQLHTSRGLGLQRVERALDDGLNEGADVLRHVVTHGGVFLLGCLCLPAIT